MSTHLVTGTAGFIGFHLAVRLLERGVDVVGFDNVNDYYSVDLKRDRLARLHDYDDFTFVEADLADAQRVDETFPRTRLRACRQPGGPGRRPLLADQSASLYAEQHRRLSQHSRGVSPRQDAASDLRQQQQCLWRRNQDAVLDLGSRRSPAEPVRGNQEEQRVDGAHVQPSVRFADDRTAVLYRLRSLGPARHGVVSVHQSDPRRPSDRRLQRRQDAPRLHLHRRHCRGSRSDFGADRGSGSRLE